MSKRDTRKITSKHKAFADEYLNNGNNATQAYIATFEQKKPSIAKVQASILLTNSNLQKYIREQQEKIAKKKEVTFEQMIDELREVIQDAKETGNLSEFGATMDRRSVIGAVKELNKMLGFHATEKKEIEVKTIKPISYIRLDKRSKDV